MPHNTSLSLRFKNISSSNELVEIAENEVRSLRRRHPRVISCNVIVGKRHRRHRKGNPIHARVTLELVDRTVLSSKEVNVADADASASVALCQAFHAAEHGLVVHESRTESSRRGHHHRKPSRFWGAALSH